MDNRLMRLLKYGDVPTAFVFDRANGKHFRKKYESFNSFISDCNKNAWMANAVIDDVFGQKSLLDDKGFIMVYAHEEED